MPGKEYQGFGIRCSIQEIQSAQNLAWSGTGRSGHQFFSWLGIAMGIQRDVGQTSWRNTQINNWYSLVHAFFLMVRGQLFVFDTTNFEKMLVGSETNALIYPRHNYNLSLSWFWFSLVGLEIWRWNHMALKFDNHIMFSKSGNRIVWDIDRVSWSTMKYTSSLIRKNMSLHIHRQTWLRGQGHGTVPAKFGTFLVGNLFDKELIHVWNVYISCHKLLCFWVSCAILVPNVCYHKFQERCPLVSVA